MKKLFHASALFCAMFLAIAAHIRAAVLPYRVLNALNPSPSEAFKCMIIDRDGLIWLGSNFGLHSYDGYRLTNYSNSEQTPNLLPNNNILCIAEDHSGHLWIGTSNGLASMDKRTGKFVRYTLKGTDNRIVYALFTSRDGTLWIGTDDGITAYNPTTKTFTPYTAANITIIDEEGKQRKGRINTVKSFAQTKDGLLFVGTWSNKFYRFDPQSRRAWTTAVPLSSHAAPSETMHTYMLQPDSYGRIWAGTWGDGVKCVAQPLSQKAPGISSFYDGDLSHAIVYHLAEEPLTRKMWLCTRGGVGLIDARNPKETQFYNTIAYNDVLVPLHNVVNFATDGKGNVWILTVNNGFYHISTRQSPFLSLNVMPADMPANRIQAIHTDDGRHYWLSLVPSGLAYFDSQTGTTLCNKQIPQLAALPYDVVNSRVTDFIRKDANELWMANNAYGIVAIKGGRATIYNRYNCPFVRYDNVCALFKARDGVIYVGERQGLTRLSPTGNTASLLDGVSVKHITQDHRGHVWVATENVGIVCIENKGKTTTRKYYNARNGNFNFNDALLCYEDSHRRLWALSNSGGLYRFDAAKDRFVSVSQTYHWDVGQVFSIVEDRQGRLWLTTDNALVCLQVDKNGEAHYATYTREDGLGTLSFQPNSAFAWHDKLVLGAGRKLILMNVNMPVPSGKQLVPYPLMVTDILVDGVRYNQLDSIVRQEISACMPAYTRRITIPTDISKFSVEFALLSYTNAARSKYMYLLEGYHTDWHYSDANIRQATFENLPSGTYKLKLRAADSYGRWVELPYMVIVRVLPPWYATWWAFLLYVALAIVVLYLAQKAYRARILTQNKLQMQVVFTNITHELLTPLAVIGAAAESISQEHEATQNETNIIKGNVSKLTLMLRQILELRKAQAGKLKLHVAYEDMGTFAQNVAQNIAPLFKPRGIRFYEEINTEASGWFDRDKVEKIVYNLLSNAAKYTQDGGEVTLTVADTGDNMLIRVADTGIGMSKKMLKNLYSRFLDGDYRRMSVVGTGIGLNFVRDLVNLHHGKINCQSQEGKGTVFEVTIPIARNAYPTDAVSDDNNRNAYRDKAAKPNEIILAEPLGESYAQTLNANQDANNDKEYTILLVEDNRELLMLMQNRLAKHYNVLTATDGQKAQKVIEKRPLDIVVTDVMMPVMDGNELCQWIKGNENFTQLPVIMLTAKATDAERNEGLRIGADEYMTKPFNLADLQLRIDNIIANRERVRRRFQKQTAGDIEAKHYSSPEEVFVKKAIDTLMEHIPDFDYGREQLAVDLCVSSSTLYNKLRAATGMNVTGFITSIRLKEACRILKAEPGIRVNELSYRVGFSTPRYFSQCFKKEYGQSVSQFIENENKATS